MKHYGTFGTILDEKGKEQYRFETHSGWTGPCRYEGFTLLDPVGDWWKTTKRGKRLLKQKGR